MGWSCTAAAGDTLRKWSEACRKATGSANSFEVNGKRYFFEGDGIEHDGGEIDGGHAEYDGAASGDVYEMVGDSSAIKVGSYFIRGDGTIEYTSCGNELRLSIRLAPDPRP